MYIQATVITRITTFLVADSYDRAGEQTNM